MQLLSCMENLSSFEIPNQEEKVIEEEERKMEGCLNCPERLKQQARLAILRKEGEARVCKSFINEFF